MFFINNLIQLEKYFKNKIIFEKRLILIHLCSSTITLSFYVLYYDIYFGPNCSILQYSSALQSFILSYVWVDEPLYDIN